MHPLIIGVDIGTSSTKVVAVDRLGMVLAEAQEAYPLLHPEPGYAEQDPEQIWAAVVAGLGKVQLAIPEDRTVLGISFSAAMHSLMALDDQHLPLTPLITWADTRSQSAADQLHQSGRAAALHAATGVPVHPMSPLCKLIWMQEHLPSVMARASMLAGIKEYVLFRLTGRWIIDQSIASATGLFNIHHLNWDEEALGLAGIRQQQLPRLVQGTDAVPISADAQLPFSFRGDKDAPVWLIPGASDGCLANLGSGAMDQGSMSLTIGTSGAVRMTLPAPVSHPDQAIFQYLLMPGWYVCGGPINNGGVALRWFSESILGKAFRDASDMQVFMEAVEQAPVGSDGVSCLPWFLGERAPVWDARATGVFEGLTIRHTRSHLMRALTEGIGFSLRMIADGVERSCGPVNRMLASGGFTASSAWVQMIADIFQQPVDLLQERDASALGAVMMGFIATGHAEDAKDFPGWHDLRQRFLPNPALREAYAAAYALFRERLSQRQVHRYLNPVSPQ